MRQAAAGPADNLFEQTDLVIGSDRRQTVVTGFLLGGAVADLGVLQIDESGDRRLQVHAFRGGTWVPALEATLSRQALFVDVANIDGRDRLITYEPGRLSWFDPESLNERALVAVTCDFHPPRGDELPHVDVTRDVNGDGRDDLVLLGAEGFSVLVQRADGVFANPVEISSAPEMSRIYGSDGPRFAPWTQSRIHQVDYDLDGRSDLVIWNEDHFDVHLQDETGLFAPVATTFTTEVAFDSDQLSSLATGDMTGKVLHSLTDLDGDGIGDLVVFSLQGEALSGKRSAYEVHFGTPALDGGTEFAAPVDVAIRSRGRRPYRCCRSDGIQVGMDRHDLDRDGQVDLMFTVIEVGFLESHVFRNLRGFMGGSLLLDLEFYRMEGGRYGDRANATQSIKLRFPPTHREPGWVALDVALRGGTDASRSRQERRMGAFNSTLLVGDVTGDGRSDLVFGWTRGRLRVHVGVPGPDLFARQRQEVAVSVPDDGEYAWLVDLDQDGTQEILLHYPSDSEPDRVTLLRAR